MKLFYKFFTEMFVSVNRRKNDSSGVVRVFYRIIFGLFFGWFLAVKKLIFFSRVQFARYPYEEKSFCEVNRSALFDLNKDGYAHVGTLCEEVKSFISDEYNRSFDKPREHEDGKYLNQTKEYLKVALGLGNMESANYLLQLATSDVLRKLAISYLGPGCYLRHINYWKSEVTNLPSSGSQLFHIDHEAPCQIKFFFLLSDVEEINGPTYVVRKIDSREVLASSICHAKHGLDIYDFECVPITGKSGEVYAIDTSKCVHRGALLESGTRKVAVAQYLPCDSYTVFSDQGDSFAVEAPRIFPCVGYLFKPGMRF